MWLPLQNSGEIYLSNITAYCMCKRYETIKLVSALQTKCFKSKIRSDANFFAKENEFWIFIKRACSTRRVKGTRMDITIKLCIAGQIKKKKVYNLRATETKARRKEGELDFLSLSFFLSFNQKSLAGPGKCRLLMVLEKFFSPKKKASKYNKKTAT